MTAAPDLPSVHAARRPRAVALRDADTGWSCTWSQLDERVARVARVLTRAFGLGPGDRVGLVAENCPQVFELQFACMRIGALFVPLNWRLATLELHSIVQDAGPALIVHDGPWRSVALELAAKVGVPTLSWDDPDARADSDYEQLLWAAEPLTTQPRDLDDLTHILYTSGTTGVPKGSLSSHGTLFWQATNLSHTSSLAASPGGGSSPATPAHMLNPLPLFHAGGLLTVAMPVLHYGGQVSTMRRFRPDAICDALADPTNAITHLSLIPAMYAAIAAQPGFGSVDLSGIRCAVVAGAVAPPELLRTWRDRGARMQPQYGGTEMGPCALVLDVSDVEKADLGSTGQPPMHTELRLVDTVTGQDCEDGRSGEIWLRGPAITRGYWGKDSQFYFGPDGWFRTGDAAWRDAEGYYYYAGRTKEMYKSGGENVYPAEVELVLAKHPDIAEIVILGVPDARWGEVGLAVVVPAAGRSPTLDSLRSFAADRLARYKLPAELVVVESLERNVTGKVSREHLRELYGGAGLSR